MRFDGENFAFGLDLVKFFLDSPDSIKQIGMSISFLTFAALLVDMVWKARNEKVILEKLPELPSVLHRILSTLLSRITLCSNSTPILLATPSMAVPQLSPPITIHVDTSFKNGVGAIGLIVKLDQNIMLGLLT